MLKIISIDIVFKTTSKYGDPPDIQRTDVAIVRSFRIPDGAPSKTCNLEALRAFLWVIRDLPEEMQVQ